jgi:hypothetical protein
MKRLLLYSPLILAALLTPSLVSACTCICKKYGDGNPAAMKNHSSAVFVGEVVESGEPTKPKDQKNFIGVIVKFRVERYWKGVQQQEITVRMSWACCNHPNPKVGSKYLVYAVGKNRETTCTRTQTLDLSSEDLRVLGPGKTFDEPNRATGNSPSD